VEKKLKGLRENVNSELIEFSRLLGKEQSSTLETLKRKIISSAMVEKMEKQLMEEIGSAEKRLEAKITRTVDDALSRSTFQFVTSDSLDSWGGGALQSSHRNLYRRAIATMLPHAVRNRNSATLFND
jgi:hypothetical protein